jgi:YggT family protein
MTDNMYIAASANLVSGALFGLYILAVMVRLLLQWARADFYNPVSQFIVKITNPVVIPLRRIVPSLGRTDTASVLILLILQIVELALTSIIIGQALSGPSLAVGAIAALMRLFFNVYIFSILIQVVLSWIGPGTYNPLTALLHSLTEPVLRPFQRLIAPIAGIDLSPLFAVIALQLMQILLVAPIAAVGRTLA